jgi:hypothetical protein
MRRDVFREAREVRARAERRIREHERRCDACRRDDQCDERRAIEREADMKDNTPVRL